jgi:hypothetical protein
MENTFTPGMSGKRMPLQKHNNDAAPMPATPPTPTPPSTPVSAPKNNDFVRKVIENKKNSLGSIKGVGGVISNQMSAGKSNADMPKFEGIKSGLDSVGKTAENAVKTITKATPAPVPGATPVKLGLRLAERMKSQRRRKNLMPRKNPLMFTGQGNSTLNKKY